MEQSDCKNRRKMMEQFIGKAVRHRGKFGVVVRGENGPSVMFDGNAGVQPLTDEMRASIDATQEPLFQDHPVMQSPTAPCTDKTKVHNRDAALAMMIATKEQTNMKPNEASKREARVAELQALGKAVSPGHKPPPGAQSSSVQSGQEDRAAFLRQAGQRPSAKRGNADAPTKALDDIKAARIAELKAVGAAASCR